MQLLSRFGQMDSPGNLGIEALSFTKTCIDEWSGGKDKRKCHPCSACWQVKDYRSYIRVEHKHDLLCRPPCYRRDMHNLWLICLH